MKDGNLCGSRENAKKDYFPGKCGTCTNLVLETDPCAVACGIHGCRRVDLSGGKDIINYVKQIPEYFDKLKAIGSSGSI